MGEATGAVGSGSREPRERAGATGEEAPPTEADRLEALGEEIIRLAAHLQAGEARLLELRAELDRRRG